MKLDLHVHTVYSADGLVEPTKYLKILKKTDLNGFAVTDHNEVKGALKVYNLAKNIKEVTIIRGIEVSSLSGHILAYGVTDLIPRGLPADETKEKIINSGGVPVAAHPYRMASGLGSVVVKKVKFPAIEILNHRSPKRENTRAEKLAIELKTGRTGGSDAHVDRELGLAATEFENNVSTEADILQEISKGRTTPVGESSTYIQGLKMYGKLVVHWLKRGFRRV